MCEVLYILVVSNSYQIHYGSLFSIAKICVTKTLIRFGIYRKIDNSGRKCSQMKQALGMVERNFQIVLLYLIMFIQRRKETDFGEM